MKKLLLLVFLVSLTVNAQEKKNYFIHLTSDPMKNPSAAAMSIAAASEALKQNHSVIFFAAGDGTKILIKDVIKNIHTVTSFSGASNKFSQWLEKSIIEFSNKTLSVLKNIIPPPPPLEVLLLTIILSIIISLLR